MNRVVVNCPVCDEVENLRQDVSALRRALEEISDFAYEHSENDTRFGEIFMIAAESLQ